MHQDGILILHDHLGIIRIARHLINEKKKIKAIGKFTFGVGLSEGCG